MKLLPVRWIAMSLLSVAGLASLSACVPLVVGGGAAGAVLVAVDRRTSGMQLEDGRIEQKSVVIISGFRLLKLLTLHNENVIL